MQAFGETLAEFWTTGIGNSASDPDGNIGCGTTAGLAASLQRRLFEGNFIDLLAIGSELITSQCIDTGRPELRNEFIFEVAPDAGVPT